MCDSRVFSTTGYLYVVGGYDGSTCLDSVDRYDPKVDQWTLMRRLLTPRSGVSLVACGASLFVIGGFNGEHRLDTGETDGRDDVVTGNRETFSALLALCERNINST